ncbi:phage head closure protein [Mesorhizobium sp. NBSH29]|uniref:phage head closure protein n=1 Tax=Mesorhizobium sp. NBSH29 TaxID=2654249 RepID=UPI0018965493|nr:phage head closure protein [Mesorhizobium sp. NBSH29]QPC87413.1 phage head closure protein [Mesorhizobium sp. NBSH29]
MPGAGKLDRRITIERFTSIKDEYNEDVETWAALTTVWAQRKDVSDGENFAAGQVGSILRSRFVIRSSLLAKTITPVDRLNYDGAIWNIQGVKETAEGRNQFIEITAVRDADI